MSQFLLYLEVNPSLAPCHVSDRVGCPGRARKIPSRVHAFTLIELLVATAVLSLVLVLVLSVISQTSTVWRRSTDKIEAFQSARAAFDLLTRNLSQATLNSYLDYDNADQPTKYLRKAELKFLSTPAGPNGGTPNTGQAVFFQAPASLTGDGAKFGGLEGLLNTVGYYVEFGSDALTKPTFVGAADKFRYRLMQLLVPTENNTIYSASNNGWVTGFSADAMPVADNIIALIIRPQDPGMISPPATLPGVVPPDLSTDYIYDSAHSYSGEQPVTSNQLPPVMQVTMVAIDETAAKRLEKDSAQPSAITSALSGKFQNPASYDADLQALETALNNANPPISYRVFSSAVPIRESKWTK